MRAVLEVSQMYIGFYKKLDKYCKKQILHSLVIFLGGLLNSQDIHTRKGVYIQKRDVTLWGFFCKKTPRPPHLNNPFSALANQQRHVTHSCDASFCQSTRHLVNYGIMGIGFNQRTFGSCI